MTESRLFVFVSVRVARRQLAQAIITFARGFLLFLFFNQVVFWEFLVGRPHHMVCRMGARPSLQIHIPVQDVVTAPLSNRIRP
jgi:hypothetical protein